MGRSDRWLQQSSSSYDSVCHMMFDHKNAKPDMLFWSILPCALSEKFGQKRTWNFYKMARKYPTANGRRTFSNLASQTAQKMTRSQLWTWRYWWVTRTELFQWWNSCVRPSPPFQWSSLEKMSRGYFLAIVQVSFFLPHRLLSDPKP